MRDESSRLYMAETAIYLRKSRAEELTDSTSEVLDRHREVLTELAKRYKVVVAAVYEEVVSGESIAKRPEMQKLLREVREGRYKAVLCMDIDRLGRGNMKDQGVLIETFQRSNTLIVTPDKIYDLNDDIDEELTEFKAFFARREWKVIRKRMRRGLLQTINGGGYIANAPYGYRQCRVGKAPNDMPTLEIVPDEARFVEYVYARYAQGVGATVIASELNAMGSVPRRGKTWGSSTVRNMLRNPTYKGYVAWDRVKRVKPTSDEPGAKGYAKHMPESDWLLVKGLHPAIIHEDEWNRAQDIRKSKYIPPSNNGHCKSSLSGLVVCARCGRKMQRLGDSSGHPRLCCIKKGCSSGSNFQYVEDAVLISLEQRMRQLKLMAAQNQEGATEDEQTLLSGLKRERERIEKRIPKLYELLEDGVYDLATFRSRKAAADTEAKLLSEQIAALEGKISQRTANNLRRAADEIERVLELWPDADVPAKNGLLKGVVKKIVYSKEPGSGAHGFKLEIEPLNME